MADFQKFESFLLFRSLIFIKKNPILIIILPNFSGKEVAVIYGGLPPGTKLAQAAKFNDPNNSCKVMVATDAIGMGLNLYVMDIYHFYHFFFDKTFIQ